jgi:hypothetical protein
MNIQGSEERILDSVLPHEVTHTVFATHFRRPLPRWADEGACTTVEHSSERAKQDRMLISFLRTGRGISFSQMFAMTDYPQDILPLYSQGYSLARFLIDQKGKREFLAFVGDGLNSENWTSTTERHYGYKNLAALQDTWLDWVKQGSPLRNPAAQPNTNVLVAAAAKARPESNLVVRAQSADRGDKDSRRQPPVRNGSVVIDPGQTVVAMSNGPPPAPTPVAVGGDASLRAATVGFDLRETAAWKGPERTLVQAGDPPSQSGRSVYGDGVGLVQHSSDGGSKSAAAATASNDDSANQVAIRTAQRPREPMLEWSRQ